MGRMRFSFLMGCVTLWLWACGGDPSGGNTNDNRNDGVIACGNGAVEGLEECDDGDDNSDTLPDACRTNCVEAHCGDGVSDSSEACDDGVQNSDIVSDACRTDCTEARCGDGVVDVANQETCDHGGTPSAVCGAACLAIYCGNGVVDPGELCDDGNNLAADGCSPDCQSVEECGNGIVDFALGEVCDCGDASMALPSGCSAPNGDPDGECSEICISRYCGNGNLDPGEVCDDGNNASTDGCAGNCMSDETCGNGVTDSLVGEGCDCGTDPTALPSGCTSPNGAVDSECSAQCVRRYCGNGVIELAEICDQGLLNSDMEPDACRTNCVPPTCGDQVIDSGELCDGSNLGGLTCLDFGSLSAGTLFCTSSCEFDIQGCPAVCGNGAVEPGETCDDGNSADWDGCTRCTAGDGSFVNLADPSIIGPPVAAADMNGDGHLDIVGVAISGGYYLQILLGDGQGNFTPASQQYNLNPVQPGELLVVDLDGDGAMDVLVAPYYNTSLAFVYRNLGNGILDLVDTIPVPPATVNLTTTSPIAGDFDEDGHADIIMVRSGAQLFLGLGGAVFSDATEIPGLDDAGFLATADFDEDGHLDIMASPKSYSSGMAYWMLRGVGDGSFGAIETVAFSGISGYSAFIAAGDIDGDGHADVAVADNSGTSWSPSVGVFFGDGAGAFTYTRIEGATNDGGARPHLVDLDANGSTDIVSVGPHQATTATTHNGTLEYHCGRGVGSASGRGSSMSSVVGDFDEDGYPDLIDFTSYANYTGATLRLHRGDGAGCFISPGAHFSTSPPPPTQYVSPIDVRLADMTGNGRLDAVVLDYYNGIGVMRNDGVGGFETAMQLVDPTCGGSMAVFDVDHDGALDVVVGDTRGMGVRATDVCVVYGTGTGGLVLGPNLDMNTQYPTQLLGAADFDGDGWMDLLLDTTTDGLAIVWNDSGAFTDLLVGAWTSPDRIQYAVAGDLNGDGLPELVTSTYRDVLIRVYGNLGSRSLGTPTDVSERIGRTSTGLAIGDINGDGLNDVITSEMVTSGMSCNSDPSDWQLGVLLGTGGGSLASPAWLDLGCDDLSNISAFYLSNDGYADLVGNGGRRVVLSNGTAIPSPPQTYWPGLLSNSGFAVGDVDGDDVLDIILAGNRTGDLRVLRGREATQ